MTMDTFIWLRETFGSDLTIHTNNETGERFIYFNEVMELCRLLEDMTIIVRLWAQPGAETWIVFRGEYVPDRESRHP